MTVLNDLSGDCFQNVAKIQKAHNREIRKVAFTRDSENQTLSLVTCAHDSIKLWSISNISEESVSLSEEQEIKGWRNGTQDFDITSNGKLAAVVSVDSILHQITMPTYDQPKGSIETFDIGFMEIWFVCIAPDQSEYISTSFSGSLIALDMTGKVTKTAPFNGVKQISAMVYSPDGKSLAVANNEGIVTIVDSSNLNLLFNFEAHALKVRALCFAPDSKHIVTGSDDKTVKLYEISGNKAQHNNTFCGHRNYVTAVQFDRSYGGQRFASCSNDSSVIVWSAQSTSPLYIFRDLHDGVITSISFSFDNQFLASVGEDRAVCINRVDDGSRQITDKYDDFVNEGETQSQDYDSNMYDNEEISEYSTGLLGADYQPGVYLILKSYRVDVVKNSNMAKHQEEGVDNEIMARASRSLDAVIDEEKPS